jgi:hypothetical protein
MIAPGKNWVTVDTFNAASSTRRVTSTPSSRRRARPTSGRACAGRIGRQCGGGAAAPDGAGDLAGAERSSRCRRQYALGAGGNADGAEAGAVTDATALLRDDENLIGTVRHITRNIKRWRKESDLIPSGCSLSGGGPRERGGGRRVPTMAVTGNYG